MARLLVSRTAGDGLNELKSAVLSLSKTSSSAGALPLLELLVDRAFPASVKTGVSRFFSTPSFEEIEKIRSRANNIFQSTVVWKNIDFKLLIRNASCSNLNIG